MATRKLIIMSPCMVLLFTICLMVEAAPRPPPLQHHSTIPGASENEIEENVNEIHDDDKVDKEMDDLGLEYGRYLQEIVKALDDDPIFSKKLENVTHEQIMNGHVARIIDQVAPDVRSRLDELKRIELDRLRQLTMKEHRLEEEIEEEQKRRDGAYKNNDDDLESGRRWRTTISKERPPRVPTPLLDDGNAPHIDHRNPHTFEAEDLQKLILQATKDLDELDKKRRRDFKQYEMEKELHHRESMQNMTAEQKAEEEKKQEEIKRKHQEHPKVHHPGSRQQFEQVWEEQDHMPKQEFNPKLFFQMHDINGDGFLDQEEVESLLTVEVRKLYNEKDPSYDRNEMIEEFHRMREHIYKEIDANHDGLISRKEFLDYSSKEEFNRDDGWKGIEEAPVYTEEELKRYEHERRQLQEHYAKYGAYNLPVQPGMQEYAYQPVYYQVADPNQHQTAQHQGQQQVYVVNAAPEHIQQPVQYQHVQLPPQTYQQQQQHPAQIAGQQQHHQQQQQQYHPQQQQQQQQYHPQQQQHQSSMPNQVHAQQQQPMMVGQAHAQQQQQPMMVGQAQQQQQLQQQNQAAHVAIQMNHPQQPQPMHHQMPNQQFQGQPQQQQQQSPHHPNQYGQPPQQHQPQQQQQQAHYNQMPAQPAQHPK